MLEAFNSLKLDKDSHSPLYMQLYEKLKELIESGVLLADCRLPSVRSLAEILGVNQVTVVSAFRQLESESLVYTRPGSGTYVADISLHFSSETVQFTDSIRDELYGQDDATLINGGRVNISDITINFASATPTPDLFPVDNFKIVLNEVLERDKGNAFSYQESQGFFPLRESIMGLLQKSGLACSMENIQVISGAQQGIDIISKALIRQGDCIITESPTYTGAVAVFKSRAAQIVDVQMDTDGPDLNILEYNIRKCRPRFIYTIPSFQNPTGYSYSNSKRYELLNLAQRYGFYIIEDDYVSDLDFEGRRYISLKALDKHNRVILIKSFSKIFMPGLRLGFMIVPSELSGNMLAAKHTSDISTSGLIQRAFDLYVRKGYWDTHFKFMYDIYKERYEKTTEVLDRHIPNGCSYIKPGGGLNLWLGLPYGFPVNTLATHASADEIVFAPGRIFYNGNAPQAFNNIRLSFAAVSTEQIEAGIENLCLLIGRLHNNGRARENIPIL